MDELGDNMFNLSDQQDTRDNQGNWYSNSSFSTITKSYGETKWKLRIHIN